MNQPAREDEIVRCGDQTMQQLQAIADELRTPAQWQTLLERQLAAVSRDTVREQALPCLAEFMGILERGTFEPRNPAAVTPVVMGTEIRPDDDVLAMDATVPRDPDLTEED